MGRGAGGGGVNEKPDLIFNNLRRNNSYIQFLKSVTLACHAERSGAMV